MVDNIISKRLGLVLIATAHMVLNGSGQTEVTGILGSNITLQFSFNKTVIHNNSYFAVYINGGIKIDDCNACKRNDFSIYPENTSVLYHITNLKPNNSGVYWVSIIGVGPPVESSKMLLNVHEENMRTTAPSLVINKTTPINRGEGSSHLSFYIVILVVSSVVVLVLVLPCLIWCFVRTKDMQQQPQQNLNPPTPTNSTVEERVQESNRVTQTSLVYSVLDFPKRSPEATLEKNQNNTEYAAVSYLTEKRQL